MVLKLQAGLKDFIRINLKYVFFDAETLGEGFGWVKTKAHAPPSDCWIHGFVDWWIGGKRGSAQKFPSIGLTDLD
jgi:hypothetical protein